VPGRALADKCDEMFRATREVLGQAQPARVAACPPPVPPADDWIPPVPHAGGRGEWAPPVPPVGRRGEAPPPRCYTPVPLPCYEPCGPHHTTTIYNGARIKRETYVWRHGSWRSRGQYHK